MLLFGVVPVAPPPPSSWRYGTARHLSSVGTSAAAGRPRDCGTGTRPPRATPGPGAGVRARSRTLQGIHNVKNVHILYRSGDFCVFRFSRICDLETFCEV